MRRLAAGSAPTRQNGETKEEVSDNVSLHLHFDKLLDPNKKYRSKNSGYFNLPRIKKHVNTTVNTTNLLCTKFFSRTPVKALLLILFLIGAGYATFVLLSLYPRFYLCPWFSTIEAPIPSQRTFEERMEFVENTVRQNRKYLPITDPESNMVSGPDGAYDIYDCPLEPPSYYPIEFPIMDVLENWPLTDFELRDERNVYQGFCIFDFSRHGAQRVRQMIHNYQKAEKPFLVKNDPEALKTVERWNTENYLEYKLQNKVFRGEFSESLSMMYWNLGTVNRGKAPKDFVPPTKLKPTTFARWKKRALEMESNTTTHGENGYFRLDACPYKHKSCAALHRGNAFEHGMYYFTRVDNADFIQDELPFFSPRYADRGISKDYLVEPKHNKGIQCRFGAKGLVAENHFDNERNAIGVFGGERRYLLGHPNNCKDMALFPQKHPLERHSEVDWNAPDLTQFPDFERVHVNEVVLQAGDIMYLPTYWFHHIVSLNMNYQCNARSGYSLEYDEEIFACGFLYGLPKY